MAVGPHDAHRTGVPTSMARRATLQASGVAALGVFSLVLPRAAAAASPGTGSADSASFTVAGITEGGCAYFADAPEGEKGVFGLEVILAEGLAPAGSDYRLSLSDGPWVTASEGPRYWDPGELYFTYFPLYSASDVAGQSGCSDPLLAQIDADYEGIRPNIRIGRFVNGVLVSTSNVILSWRGQSPS